MGPVSMITGSTPTVVWSTILARGFSAELVGLLAGHEQHRGGAVGDLGGVAGGDLAVLLEGRLQRRQLLGAVGVGGPDALVGDVGVAVVLPRDDLALEAALLGRLVGELVGAEADLIHLGAGDLPLVGDHLGGDALRDEVVALHQRRGEGEAVLLHDLGGVGEGDVAHVLDAAADDDVMDAGGDQRGAEVDGLLCRAALAVDGGGGRLDREPGLEPGVARDVDALLTELLHTAGDDVLDLGAVDTGPLDDLVVSLREQARRVDVLVITLLLVPASDRQPGGLHDHYLASTELSVLSHLGPPKSVSSSNQVVPQKAYTD